MALHRVMAHGGWSSGIDPVKLEKNMRVSHKWGYPKWMVYFWKTPLKKDDPHKDPNNQQDRVISAQCQGVTDELKSREGFGELPCWGGGAENAA